MSRLLLAALISMTLLPGCEGGGNLTTTSDPTYCVINWSGMLPTDGSVFTLQACWNGRCTGGITLQSATGDAGAAPINVDAGCTPAPTTPGGLPSGCRAARTQGTPITPSGGCAADEIGDQFSVHACARASSKGHATFDVRLTPFRPSYPSLGGEAALRIQTTGVALLSSEGTVPSAEGTPAPCQGAHFALDGTLRGL